MDMEPINKKYESFLTDESHIKGECEEIFFPESPEELYSIIKKLNKENKKITIEGSRTGLKGGCVPNGGAVLNLSKLNKIGEIVKTEDGAVITAQCGATLEEVSKIAQSKGYFLPVNPTEETASIGGMFSTNASGPNSLYYASFSKYVKELCFTLLNGESFKISRGEYRINDKKLILPNKKEINFNNLSEKLPFAFYEENMDLIDFLAGKEGFFGIAQEMTISLLKDNLDLWGTVFFFENEKNALDFLDKVKEISFENANLTTAEYLNSIALNLIKSNLKNPLLAKLPELPKNANTAIYIETEGIDEDSSAEALMNLLDIFSEAGGNEDDTWAQNGTEAVKGFRDMRHAVVSILNEDIKIHSEKGYRFESDIKAPEDKYREYLSLYNETAQKYSLNTAIYGAVLQNHLHAAFIANTQEDKINSEKALEEIYNRAAEDNALIGAKYGIGRVNRNIISKLLSDSDKKAIKDILKAFDENSLMYP